MRRRVAALLTLVVVTAVALSGPGPAYAEPGTPDQLSLPETATAAGEAVTDAYGGKHAAIVKAWAADFATLQKSLSGPAGVSVLPVGASEGTGTVTVGSWRHGVAWSTSKVPLSVAALRVSKSKTTRKLVHRAITKSDNAAAQRLWDRLGSGRTAGRKVQKVIRDAGDGDTKVQTRQVRPPYTAFGQTKWTLADQARFAAGLSCLGSAKPVRKEMAHITSGQRWGLGHVKDTIFKGGWGPVKKGYLVRQLGIVTPGDGSKVGVAIAVYSPKGFSRGTKDLTKVANWLEARIGDIDGGRC